MQCITSCSAARSTCEDDVVEGNVEVQDFPHALHVSEGPQRAAAAHRNDIGIAAFVAELLCKLMKQVVTSELRVLRSGDCEDLRADHPVEQQVANEANFMRLILKSSTTRK